MSDDVRIVLGDCLDVMAGMPDGSVDCVITDPPYGVDYRGRWNSDWSAIRNDRGLSWLPAVVVQIHRLLSRDAFAVSFYSWPDADKFLVAFKGAGFRPTSHLVFVKNRIGLGYHTRGQHEVAYLFAKGSPRAAVIDSDVFSWTRVDSPEHPMQKPIDALIPLVERYCPPFGITLDPFCGVGSTLVAARKAGRRAIGIEIDPRYCEIARRRVAEAAAPLLDLMDERRPTPLLPFIDAEAPR